MAQAGQDHLNSLRQNLLKQGGGGFIVPRADCYQNEYTHPRDNRLAWLTGFDGSAGTAIVLEKKAAVFVDGRYTLQAEQEVDTRIFEIHNSAETSPENWVKSNLQPSETLLFDPWLTTLEQQRRWQKICKGQDAALMPTCENPIDQLWTADRPTRPCLPVKAHDLAYAGVSSEEKCQKIAGLLKKANTEAVLITAPESVAWLFNIRGQDLPETPIVLSRALLDHTGQGMLFIDEEKLTPAVQTHLGDQIKICPIGQIEKHLSNLTYRTIQVDPSHIPHSLHQALTKGKTCQIQEASDPCTLPRAIKNKTEREGARAAHCRDGAALCQFLAWIDREGGLGQYTEQMASDKLFSFRQSQDLLQTVSFQTISGVGPNGAIIHYRVSPETNRPLQGPALYLVDSGGQYLDGTTDVTRTISLGAPTAEQKDRFTRVLKGHIALAQATFPEGTTGGQLDVLARQFLWQAGLDFEHGTGHGVGSYLSVHEGPQRISKSPSMVPLQPGMIVSNEPGYYKPQAYGIRIENLVLVKKVSLPEAEQTMYSFETLTMAPIDLRLVDWDLMKAEEISWLDAYHQMVWGKISDQVDDETRNWLKTATAPFKTRSIQTE